MNRNAGISYINYVDLAVLAATSEGLPVTNLQSDHLATKWRSAGSEDVAITADFGEALPVDTLGIFGTNFTAEAQWRVRLSSSAAHDGDVADSGLVAMDPHIRVDRRKKSAPVSKSQALHLLAAPVTARYLKLDFADSGRSFFEIGLAWAGTLWQTQRNFSYGEAPAVQDPSTTTTSVGGNDYTDLRPQKMTDTFSFGLMTDAEAAIALEVDQAIGTACNFLWIRAPLSATRNRDCILGRQPQLSALPSVAHDRRSRQYQIAERL
jgi:hypothetical protein